MSLTSGSSIKSVGSDIIFFNDSWIGLGDIVEYSDGFSWGDNGTCVYVLN